MTHTLTQASASTTTTSALGTFSLSLRSAEADSSLAAPPPPNYNEVRRLVAAEFNPDDPDPDPEENYITIKWYPRRKKCLPSLPVEVDGPSSLTNHPTESEAPSGSRQAECPQAPNPSQIPKVPEFRAVVSEFQKAHSDLQGYASEICDITKRLVDLKATMFNIHEYWMDVGLHDIAHGVIPILDCAANAVPIYAFPPRPHTVAPVM